MKPPRVVASVVVALLFISALQAVSWVDRAPPDWHPSWWQSHLWAGIGMLLMAPSMVLTALLSALLPGLDYPLFARGFTSGIGFTVYLVIVYVIVFRVVRWIIAQFTPPKKPDISN